MEIGKRTQVKNLRSIWPFEPGFSDWLVTDAGLDLIAQDIGISVENVRRESRPGDYPADVVGNALGDENHIIVIENQFGKTDHDHLGKLLTYAAMHSAMTGIWISEHISNDHRTVIDWLNENTPPHVSFYLAQLKVYQIGSSDAAPQLDVVSRPNLQAKISRTSDNASTNVREKWLFEVWQDILDYIASNNPPFSVQSPSGAHWSRISVGRADFWIELTLVPKNQRIACKLGMNPNWKDSAFGQLFAQQDLVEKELDQKLDWRQMLEKKSAYIVLEETIDPSDDGNRQAVKEWMLEKSVAFYKAFHDRVKKLDPSSNIVFPKVEQLDAGTSEQEDRKIAEAETESLMLIQKTQIEVVHASMMNQRVDAVVNAANPRLAYGGGITGKIFDQAGPGLPAEIKQKYPKGTPTGTAVITGGYGLKQPYIIHTPGPVWNGGGSGEAKDLVSSYRSCLEVVDANGLKSIAFCSISTGIYGFLLDKAAPLAIATVLDYLDAHPDTTLERIVFAMYEEDEYKAFVKAYSEASA